MKQPLLPDPYTALAAVGDVPSLRTAADLGVMARQEGYIWLWGLQPNSNGTWLDYENNMKWRVVPLIPNSQRGLGGWIFGSLEGRPMGSGPFGDAYNCILYSTAQDCL